MIPNSEICNKLFFLSGPLFLNRKMSHKVPLTRANFGKEIFGARPLFSIYEITVS